MVAHGLVVTVCRDDQPATLVDATAEHADGVERRLIRPVDVFEDDEHGTRHLGEEPARDCPGVGSRVDRLGKTTADSGSDVGERPKRDRSGEILARALQNGRVGARGQRTHERGLSGPRLAADEHHPAAVFERDGERREQLVTLEEVAHARSVQGRPPTGQARWSQRSVSRRLNLGDAADSAERCSSYRRSGQGKPSQEIRIGDLRAPPPQRVAHRERPRGGGSPLDRRGGADAGRRALDPQLRHRRARRLRRDGLHLPGVEPGGDPGSCEPCGPPGRRDRQGRRHRGRAARPGPRRGLRGAVMRKMLLIAGLAAVVPLLAIAGFAAAGGGQSSLADLRDATAKYHDIDVARALHDEEELAQVQPYGEGTCIANLEGPGAMGIHLLLRDRVDDVLVPDEPEALLYEKRSNGSYKLTGVEYVVAGGPQPTLYG